VPSTTPSHGLGNNTRPKIISRGAKTFHHLAVICRLAGITRSSVLYLIFHKTLGVADIHGFLVEI
jgi:hypothetical protein